MNLQNLPRGDTARVKDLIASRHGENGVILDADYGQLEFRVVGWMSGDEQLLEDVANDFDIHTHTAKMAFGEKFEQADAKGKKALRQLAKSLTFAFQYGAMPKTKVQQAIFDAFYSKYWRVKEWQDKVVGEIAGTGEYVCPFTGKVFMFPYAHHGNEASWSTKAKNYPVQYLSAVVTQCAMIEFDKRNDRKGEVDLMIQVHDSLVADSMLKHATWAMDLLKECMENVSDTFERYFDKKIPVQLDADCDVGTTYYNKLKVVEKKEDIKEEGSYYVRDICEIVDFSLDKAA